MFAGSGGQDQMLGMQGMGRTEQESVHPWVAGCGFVAAEAARRPIVVRIGCGLVRAPTGEIEPNALLPLRCHTRLGMSEVATANDAETELGVSHIILPNLTPERSGIRVLRHFVADGIVTLLRGLSSFSLV